MTGKQATRKPGTNKGGRPKRGAEVAKAAELAARQSKVADLRSQGVSWGAIGTRVGVSRSQAYRDYEAWVEGLVPMADRQALQRDWAEQLDVRAQQAMLDARKCREAGNQVGADRAERRWLLITSRQAVLTGLDEPRRTAAEVVIVPPTAERLDELLEAAVGGAEGLWGDTIDPGSWTPLRGCCGLSPK